MLKLAGRSWHAAIPPKEVDRSPPQQEESAQRLALGANTQSVLGACKMPRISYFCTRHSSSTGGKARNVPALTSVRGRGTEAGNIPCCAYGPRKKLSVRDRRVSAAKQRSLSRNTNINSISTSLPRHKTPKQGPISHSNDDTPALSRRN